MGVLAAVVVIELLFGFSSGTRLVLDLFTSLSNSEHSSARGEKQKQ